MASISPEIRKRLIGLESSFEEPYPIQVSGEASHRENIEKICGYVDEDGYDDDSHQAILYLEDDNPHDPGNAVRVEINDLTVGYLSKPDAKSYRKKLSEYGAPENAIALCGASIKGGFYKKKTDEWADYGIRLDFDLESMKFVPVRFFEDEKKISPPAPTPIPIKPKPLVSVSSTSKPKRQYKFQFIPINGSGMFYWLVMFPLFMIINFYIFIFSGLWFLIVALWDLVNQK